MWLEAGMCLPATTAVFRAKIGDPALKAALLAFADASEVDETGDEWSTFASLEFISHLCGRAVSTLRADLKRLDPDWLTRVAEYSGAGRERGVARCTYVLNKTRILAARDPFFKSPNAAELALYHRRPPPKASAGRVEDDPQPALNFSTTGAKVQRTGAKVQHAHIDELSLTEESNLGRLELADPAQAVDRKQEGLSGDRRTACVTASFPSREAAVSAVIEAMPPNGDVAALLKRARFNADLQLLTFGTETALITVRIHAGEAIKQLGLSTAGGPA